MREDVAAAYSPEGRRCHSPTSAAPLLERTSPPMALSCYSGLNLFRQASEQDHTAGPELAARGERDDATKREKSRVSQEHISGPWSLNQCVLHDVARSRVEGSGPTMKMTIRMVRCCLITQPALNYADRLIRELEERGRYNDPNLMVILKDGIKKVSALDTFLCSMRLRATARKQRSPAGHEIHTLYARRTRLRAKTNLLGR